MNKDKLLIINGRVVIESRKKKKTNKLYKIGTKLFLDNKIDIYGDMKNPLFLAKDVAEWINYAHNAKNTDSRQVDKMLKEINNDNKIKAICNSSKSCNKTKARKTQEMWFLTEGGLTEVLVNSRKIESKELLNKIDDRFVYKRLCKQAKFEIMLKEALDIHIKSVFDWKFCIRTSGSCYDDALYYETEKWVCDGKYRLDFYFPEFRLIVEYDEKRHNYQKETDKKREMEIICYLEGETEEFIEDNGDGHTIIRVEEGKEYEGIITIISHLMYIGFVG